VAALRRPDDRSAVLYVPAGGQTRQDALQPLHGMDNAHKADPNSNREWFQEEWSFAREKAPLEVLIPMMLARHCGLRGQTIVKVNRKQIVDHDMTGQAIRYYARKNRKIVTLPMMQEL
jgi:hypothetical protein